jgi:hypothetical protein
VTMCSDGRVKAGHDDKGTNEATPMNSRSA